MRHADRILFTPTLLIHAAGKAKIGSSLQSVVIVSDLGAARNLTFVNKNMELERK